MKYKLLLLDDVVNLGRKGQIVDVNPGYARNFLVPKLRGVVATKSALKMQKQLQDERAEQAKQDKAQALLLADEIASKSFSIVAKVDIEGNMYGSVKSQDIAQLLKKAGYEFERKQIQIPHTIKKIGSVKIELVLKEGVKTSFLLEVKPDKEIRKKKLEKTGQEKSSDVQSEHRQEDSVNEDSKNQDQESATE